LASSEISESDTIVRVTNGQIVAIGGLMKQLDARNRRQVPGLGDVPVVGAAFGNSQGLSDKSELVILVKPTIIKSSADWMEDLQNTRERINQFPRDRAPAAEPASTEAQ
jgi:MSHA biogenesis protein MshL